MIPFNPLQLLLYLYHILLIRLKYPAIIIKSDLVSFDIFCFEMSWVFLLLIGFILIVNCVDNELFEAINDDDVDRLKNALDNGSNINTIGPGKQTPLMFGVLGGKIKCVKLLLELNADVNIPEKDGYTPIHGAAFQGRHEILQLLIDYGINPRNKHSDGYEPIHRTSWGNKERHVKTLKVFLNNGVPINAISDNGKTVKDMAKKGTPVYNFIMEYIQKNDL